MPGKKHSKKLDSKLAVLFYFLCLFASMASPSGEDGHTIDLWVFHSFRSFIEWIVIAPILIYMISTWFMAWVREKNREFENKRAGEYGYHVDGDETTHTRL